MVAMLRSIEFLGFSIPSYFLMLILGLAAFIALFFIAFRSLYREDRVTYNRLLFVIILSVIGLGVFAFLFNSLFHSIEKGRLTFGGITWLGGACGAIATFLVLCHLIVPKKRGYEPETLSLLMPGLALGHAFGRVGCFLGGCCFGRVSDSPLAVVYPEGSYAARLYPNAEGTGSLPVLPIPLIEAAFELLLFAVMMLLPKRARKYSLPIYSVGYGIFRFVAEFYRGDERGSVGGFVTPSQLLSVALVLFGTVLLLEMSGVCFKKIHKRRLSVQAASDALPIVCLDESDDMRLLRELHSLYRDGIISEDEYEAKKKEILERI